MQPGQSVAQKVIITVLPRNAFKAIFWPVSVINVTSGDWLELLLSAAIKSNARASIKVVKTMSR